MGTIVIEIDGKTLTVEEGASVRRAALKNGIYIPGLCSHPELDPFAEFHWSDAVWQGELKIANCKLQIESDSTEAQSSIYNLQSAIEFPHCNLCLVSIDDSPPQRACTTHVTKGMTVRTTGDDIIKARRDALKLILANHPHACLTCAQREGCDRVQCSMNVPVDERCCPLLGRCEIGKVADYIGIPADTPVYHNLGRPSVTNEPLFLRDYELCVSCLRCVRVCRDVREVDVLGAVRVEEYSRQDAKAQRISTSTESTGDGGIDGIENLGGFAALREENLSVIVGASRGPTLVEALCRFCGACVEVCPTGALRDHLDTQPLIHDYAPCRAACPLDIDVPGYMELIAQGLEYEALELIRERAALPGVLGYACFHPCEDQCRRGALDKPAAVCALKRYVSDAAGDREPTVRKADSTGKRVAVVGGGPAGLQATADLLAWGHKVTVFDQADKLGGMLRQAIPGFRLPEGVLDRDLKFLDALGLQSELKRTFGSDLTLDSLTAEGWEAVILAPGLPAAAKLSLEDESMEGVWLGLDFLRQARAGKLSNMDGSTVVIGGGSVAVDAAMTARRAGSSAVKMICLEAPHELPAHQDELQAAREEGVEIMHRWGVQGIGGRRRKLRVAEVTLQRCLRVFDSQGRFAPEMDPTITIVQPTDYLIIAIGQKLPLELKSLTDSRKGIFIAGDAATGPSSIVSAMADGRKAAAKVHVFLGGEAPDKSNGKTRAPQSRSLGVDEDFHKRSRAVPVRRPASERVCDFEPFDATFTRDQAMEEAARCLRCHLRASLLKPPLPPDPWHSFAVESLSLVPESEGVLVLADEEKKTVKIAGSANMHQALEDLLSGGVRAVWCRWESDPMFTKRESEMIQSHLQAHGEIPGGDELDELF